MRIAFFEIEPWEKGFIKKRLKGHAFEFFPWPLDAESVKKVAKGGSFNAVSVFIYSHVDKAVLDALPALKLVATRSTGFDHIDTKECKARGIAVVNVPSYGENTVAEHTFALILALSRNVHKAYSKTHRHDFSIEGLKGFDLFGKTLGIIGGGHIGLHVARIGRGFGMEVLVFDVTEQRFLSEVMGFGYVPMDELLKRSDIITLHVPLIDSTRHLINSETLKHVKKGAILINTSRGAVVETGAVIEALDDKTLAGVGIDVLEGEELIREESQMLYDAEKMDKMLTLAKDHILLSRDNVVFTPHIAFYSQEALERILETTTNNITAFAKGERENEV